MRWDEELSVGIAEIDQHHRVIAECIALVEDAVGKRSEKARWSAVHASIGRLADYVRIHFAVEESLMRMHDYPEIDQHVDEHLRFARDLMSLQRKALDSDVSEDMVVFLSSWQREHIAVSDKRYAAFLPVAAVRRVAKCKAPQKRKRA